MITEYIVYKCRCVKCEKEWITKAHIIPTVCPKCHSVKWNEGCAPAPRIDAPEPVQITQPSQPIQSEPQDALAVFIAKAQAIKGIAQGTMIATEPEPIDEWTGWGKEEQTYDDQTGEMRTFRRHIKSGRVKWLDAETWFG